MVNHYALGAFGIGEWALRDFCRWGVRREKLALLPYSSQMPQEVSGADQPCALFRQDRFGIVYAGGLCHRKGIDVLLKAFASATRSYSKSVLMLVGNDQSYGAYRAMADTLGISARVLFRGPVPPQELGGILHCADLFCLPSRHDGWGVVLNEAASRGLALVASDRCGAAHHLIVPGENGVRVRAGDVRSLANALQTYVQNPILAHIHGERSHDIFRSYTPVANVRRFLSAIETWQGMQFNSRAA
ncbi:MAG: glycosyltransferase family 4 protein [Rhodopirellula sp.]|nr:glycosyltransferase family 4 protein [Rhodopirellula sp.]